MPTFQALPSVPGTFFVSAIGLSSYTAFTASRRLCTQCTTQMTCCETANLPGSAIKLALLPSTNPLQTNVWCGMQHMCAVTKISHFSNSCCRYNAGRTCVRSPLIPMKNTSKCSAPRLSGKYMSNECTPWNLATLQAEVFQQPARRLVQSAA